MNIFLSETDYVYCPVLECAILPKYCKHICKYYKGVLESGGIECGFDPCEKCRYRKDKEESG